MNKKKGVILVMLLLTIITVCLIIQNIIINNKLKNYNSEIQSNKNIIDIIKFKLQGEQNEELNENSNTNPKSDEDKNLLSSVSDLKLHDIDGNKTNYVFTYNNVQYKAIYTEDNWKIIDSYTITNQDDMAIICKALIDIHPIHGKDMKSYREVEDLVYEWKQHNLAYILLPDDNEWIQNAKDVDFNPQDQGKGIKEMYESRTGKEFKIKNLKEKLINKKQKSVEIIDKVEKKIENKFENIKKDDIIDKYKKIYKKLENL